MEFAGFVGEEEVGEIDVALGVMEFGFSDEGIGVGMGDYVEETDLIQGLEFPGTFCGAGGVADQVGWFRGERAAGEGKGERRNQEEESGSFHWIRLFLQWVYRQRKCRCNNRLELVNHC